MRPLNAKVVSSGVTLANGDVIAADRDAKVAARTERPAGIMVDAEPTDNPPRFYRLAVSGDTIYDTGLTSQTIGAEIWSDGDGTYSTTRPTAGSAGDMAWLLGHITDSDANGSYIELDIQAVPEA